MTRAATPGNAEPCLGCHRLLPVQQSTSVGGTDAYERLQPAWLAGNALYEPWGLCRDCARIVQARECPRCGESFALADCRRCPGTTCDRYQGCMTT